MRPVHAFAPFLLQVFDYSAFCCKPQVLSCAIAGDLSRNNWWVAALAFGEGWHKNHHAFEFSARHGLEKWQVDITWLVISAFQKVGLATNVKLPSERQKSRLAFE